jgi:hypothetical protein
MPELLRGPSVQPVKFSQAYIQMPMRGLGVTREIQYCKMHVVPWLVFLFTILLCSPTLIQVPSVSVSSNSGDRYRIAQVMGRVDQHESIAGLY